MKKFRRQVYAGINGKFDKESQKYKFTVDFENNTDEDVVKFLEPYFHKSKIGGHTYWFGYSFNDGQKNPRRDQFIQFLKHVQPERLVDPDDEWSGFDYNDETITESDLSSMIEMSLKRIHLNNYSVDTIVYPESKSGNLVSMIVSCITRYLNRSKVVKAEELQKSKPSKLQFDFDRFHRDIETGVIDVPQFVDDEYIKNMMVKAKSAPYFSLRKYIKPTVLRSYVSNFYYIDKNTSSIVNSNVVLVVDDFGTTGTTVGEIIRQVLDINPDCEIYIFTLMGNRRRK